MGRGDGGNTTVVDLLRTLDYPIVAIGDLHGQRGELERLVEKLGGCRSGRIAPSCFLGDFVDRGPDVRGAIDLVMELLRRPAGGSAVMGNHDLALVRAAGLDGGPVSPYWVERYRTLYDHHETFAATSARGDDVGRRLGGRPGGAP